MSSIFHFPHWKMYFSQFSFISKYLKFKEITYLIHCVNFKTWPALLYVSSLSYFQQWNWNWDIASLNSSLIQSWEFWMLVLRIIHLWYSQWIRERDHKLLDIFADSFEWQLGKDVFFLTLWASTTRESKSLFFNIYM